MEHMIFLSHGSADSEVAGRFKEQIEQMNIGVYLYEYDKHPGEYLADKLKQAIGRSIAMLVLLTKQSQHSHYVHQEIGCAVGMGKIVIPLVGPGVEDLGMLEGKEYISFDDEHVELAMMQVQASLYKKIMEMQKAALEKMRSEPHVQAMLASQKMTLDIQSEMLVTGAIILLAVALLFAAYTISKS